MSIDALIHTHTKAYRLSPALAKIAGVDVVRVLVEGLAVEIQIHAQEAWTVAFLTTDQVDELIRALAAARVELSKEPPR